MTLIKLYVVIIVTRVVKLRVRSNEPDEYSTSTTSSAYQGSTTLNLTWQPISTRSTLSLLSLFLVACTSVPLAQGASASTVHPNPQPVPWYVSPGNTSHSPIRCSCSCKFTQSHSHLLFPFFIYTIPLLAADHCFNYRTVPYQFRNRLVARSEAKREGKSNQFFSPDNQSETRADVAGMLDEEPWPLGLISVSCGWCSCLEGAQKMEIHREGVWSVALMEGLYLLHVSGLRWDWGAVDVGFWGEYF